MPNSSHYAKVDGLEMYYELHGSGDSTRPLVLLHGGVLTVNLSFAAVLPTPAAGSSLPNSRAMATPPTSTVP